MGSLQCVNLLHRNEFAHMIAMIVQEWVGTHT